MVVLKGSVSISFGGTEQPAAYGELVSVGRLNPEVNKKLSAEIASVLETKLSVPKSRFFLKLYDSKARDLIFCCCYSALAMSLSFPRVLVRLIGLIYMFIVCMLYTIK